jgi:hypothetical protein
MLLCKIEGILSNLLRYVYHWHTSTYKILHAGDDDDDDDDIHMYIIY